MGTRSSSRMWICLPFIAAEAFLYLSYRQDDGILHRLLCVVGASAALIVLGLIDRVT